jgi:hypothetical protein
MPINLLYDKMNDIMTLVSPFKSDYNTNDG